MLGLSGRKMMVEREVTFGVVKGVKSGVGRRGRAREEWHS